MSYPTQSLNEIHITKLKGLKNLKLDFTPHPLTAIMGINGCGKTTVLHAIACCYQPYTGHNSHNYIFSEFFLPNTDSRWSGSLFKIVYDHQLAPAKYPTERVYSKVSDRWTPRYATRLYRWVSYVGIKDAVPIIEELNTKSFVALTKINRNDQHSNKVLRAAQFILNRNYTILTNNTRHGRTFIGVQYKGTDYSAISMGSGEQRIFKILEALFQAPDYGLILIDEIELLLHTDALKKLLGVLYDEASNRHLQIIFTTHSEVILDFKNKINIRHIYIAENNDALCLKDTNPKLLYALTGTQVKTLNLFVEDELSREIVSKIARELGIKKDVSIGLFGPAINCFTTASGAVLNNIIIENCLFILDGDLYRTKDEKKSRINAVLTGTDFSSKRKKILALKQINEFNLPPNVTPEQYFHTQIQQQAQFSDPEREEIRQAALAIQNQIDPHNYVDEIINRIGAKKEDYKPIVDLLATLPFWANYTHNIRRWLASKKQEHNL